ncbi:unnamed protein product [Rotaria magnacalcarata]|uniref:Tetratricopeptide repeat protein n=1 Tax=Rotaria magnacalcarata TaxID=392030 RepID=A0A820H7I9_9BILA|nr:unnamed protein product [Rotaria magnacalcarata]
MGEYSKALEYYEKANNIYEISLLPTHPDSAGSYLCFAGCYEKMRDYTAVLKALQSAYKIQQKTFQEGNQAFASTFNRKALPEKHPHLGIRYSNIGDVHRLMGDYERALAFHQKALNIQENVKCNPLERATTYMNLGETYREMKDYTTALTYYQK